MQLFMVRVVAPKEQTSNWFFVAANDVREVREMCEDNESKIVDLIDAGAAMAEVLDKEFDGIVLCNNI